MRRPALAANATQAQVAPPWAAKSFRSRAQRVTAALRRQWPQKKKGTKSLFEKIGIWMRNFDCDFKQISCDFQTHF
jgi:hypothetical protein